MAATVLTGATGPAVIAPEVGGAATVTEEGTAVTDGDGPTASDEGGDGGAVVEVGLSRLDALLQPATSTTAVTAATAAGHRARTRCDAPGRLNRR